jgi:hypothetical protein
VLQVRGTPELPKIRFTVIRLAKNRIWENPAYTGFFFPYVLTTTVSVSISVMTRISLSQPKGVILRDSSLSFVIYLVFDVFAICRAMNDVCPVIA